MDEKTADLRDIFVDATGAEAVTEGQREARGSLTDADGDVDRRLADLVGRMRERYEFRTDLETPALCRLVRAYHDGADDAAIADDLGIEETTVFEARTDLHLVRESDREAPFDLAKLRRLLVEGADDDECAAALGVEASTVAEYRDVIRADLEATRANDRFRDGFRELLTDADLTARHARDVREDGLREAAEDIETDVSF